MFSVCTPGLTNLWSLGCTFLICHPNPNILYMNRREILSGKIKTLVHWESYWIVAKLWSKNPCTALNFKGFFWYFNFFFILICLSMVRFDKILYYFNFWDLKNLKLQGVLNDFCRFNVNFIIKIEKIHYFHPQIKLINDTL